MMTRPLSISRAALANVLAASLFATAAVAQDSTTTDIGTLDKATADKVFPTKPPYSPYAGRNFPDAAVLRRHAHAHLVLDGCGRIRRAARAKGRLSLRQGRGGHGVERAAGQALAAARLHRGHGPLRRHGLFSAIAERRSYRARDAAGTEMVRPDQLRPRRAGRSRHHHQLRQGADAEGFPNSGHARLPQRVARDHQGGGGGKRARPLHRLHRL